MTPAELKVLAAEITNDPLTLGYAAHLPDDPQRVIDLLTAQNYSMLKPITAARALVWAGMGGAGAIKDASMNLEHPCRDSCLAFLLTVSAGMNVDLSDKDVQDMFTGWESAKLISAESHERALVFATQTAARFEVIGIPEPTARDVLIAMEIQ